MVCQRKVISFSKCTALVGDVDNEEGYACIGKGACGKSACCRLAIEMRLGKEKQREVV